MKSYVLGACAFAASALVAGSLQAQQSVPYPQKPIRFIVPYSPGGTSDFIARLVGDAVGKELGQQLVVENRGGAGSALGTQLAAQAAPNGYTVILNNIGLAVNETLRPDRGYEALKALTPVSLVGFTPSVLVCNNDTPYKTAADFVKAAKAQPGKISFGSAGAGSSTHLSMTLFQNLAGIKLLHVPYKGGGPATRAMMAGEVQCVMAPIPTVQSHIEAGRVKALGVSGAKASSALPKVPPIAESGVPGYEFNTWYGLLTTAGTPKEAVQKLNAATVKALKSPQLRAKLQKAGLDPEPTTPEEFGKLIRSEIEKWSDLIESAGIPKVGA